jgi:hypothetical protein
MPFVWGRGVLHYFLVPNDERGVPFADIAYHTFGGDPWHFLAMNMIIINHLYMMFFHKISVRSLDQWIPTGLHTCRRLIYDALSDGAIKEVEYENGEVVDTQLIRHHFHFGSVHPFIFLDDFAIPSACPWSSARQNHNFQHDNQRTFYSGYLQ